MKRLYGVHTSVSGGILNALREAVSLKCTTFQFFLQSPRIWKKRSLDSSTVSKFLCEIEKAGFSCYFIHCSYLVNLLSENSSVQKKSLEHLLYELKLSSALKSRYYILHLKENRFLSIEEQVKKLKDQLQFLERNLNQKGFLLIENSSSGQVFSNLSLLSEVYKELKSSSELLGGLCLDTAHLHGSGYSFDEKGIQKIILELGAVVSEVRLIHLNDSKANRGSKADRHEHLGKGKIGFENLKMFLETIEFSVQPIILETPKQSKKDDLNNLKTLKVMLGAVSK